MAIYWDKENQAFTYKGETYQLYGLVNMASPDSPVTGAAVYHVYQVDGRVVREEVETAISDGCPLFHRDGTPCLETMDWAEAAVICYAKHNV